MNVQRRALVFVAGYVPEDELPLALQSALEAESVDIATWPSATEAAAEIERLVARGARIPDVVLLRGDAVVPAAQQIRTAAPETQLTFLADWRERSELQPELRAANLAHGWAFAVPEPKTLVDLVRDAITTSGHRRQVRTTLDRSPVRISSEKVSPERVRRLTMSDALLAAIMRDTIEAILVVDDRGRIISANPAAIELFGYGDRLSRMYLRELMPGCAEPGSVAGRLTEQTAIARDGAEIPVDITVSRVTAGGAPGGFAIVVRDARERRAAHAALLRQAELTSAIVNGIAEGVYVIDAFGNLLFINSAAEELLGWKREELEQRNVHDAIHVDKDGQRLDATDCPLLQAIRRGVPLRAQEQFRRKDGAALPVECAVTPVRLDGTVIGGVFNFHDISPHREAQDQLRAEKDALSQANRAKDDFIAAVSHELRTPLTAILGWLQLVSTADAQQSELAEAFEAIEASARTQAQIVEDLLDVSRVVSGKLRLDMTRVEVGHVLSTAASTLYPSARARGVTLTIDAGPPGLAVCGDEARLNQVVWNLMSNAIKFTPEGGTVTTTAEAVNGQVAIRVSDTGEGIAPDMLPTIFDPYRQAAGATSKGGLGLGLAIVRTFVELHHGRIDVESELHRGTTFTIELPQMVDEGNCDAFVIDG